MKRILLLAVCASVLAIPGPGAGSPVEGKLSLGRQRIPERARARIDKEFRGGERACVIVKGDHEPVVDLELSVYDDRGKLVAEDKAGGDFVAVIWYPPRDAVYRIEFFNPGAAYNDLYISLK
jgi:hypothetical protein